MVRFFATHPTILPYSWQFFSLRRWFTLCLLLLTMLGCTAARSPELSGWGPILPSNDRNWMPNQMVLPYAEIEADQVYVYNIRNCDYRTKSSYEVRHYNKAYDLRDITSVDFIVVPFAGATSLAHTMLSFEFNNDEYLAVSVEIRKERGETYEPLAGMLNQFELMYVLGDERDLIGLRTNHRLEDVYVYRASATPEQARRLFMDVMQRINKLSVEPEFYNTLTNNCTTNIRRHINKLSPDTIPYDYRVLLPGLSDRLAFDLGLLERNGSFEQARVNARVNQKAFAFRDDPEFSKKIRR